MIRIYMCIYDTYMYICVSYICIYVCDIRVYIDIDIDIAIDIDIDTDLDIYTHTHIHTGMSGDNKSEGIAHRVVVLCCTGSQQSPPGYTVLLKEVRKEVTEDFGGRSFQAEGTTSVKVLKLKS